MTWMLRGILTVSHVNAHIYSAFKGEGIAPIQTGKELGRGAQANGGGGALHPARQYEPGSL